MLSTNTFNLVAVTRSNFRICALFCFCVFLPDNTPNPTQQTNEKRNLFSFWEFLSLAESKKGLDLVEIWMEGAQHVTAQLNAQLSFLDLHKNTVSGAILILKQEACWFDV